jgi:ATP-binding cassette, subfamily C (CFTR/MRP), member 4
VLEFFAIMILVSIVNVYFAIPTVIMAAILVGFRHIYVTTSRNMKRVESISRSPIFAHTNATLQGLSTIRAFKAEQAVMQNFNEHVNTNASVKVQTLIKFLFLN